MINGYMMGGGRERAIAAAQAIFATTPGAMWLPDPAAMFVSPDGKDLAAVNVGTGLLYDQSKAQALGPELATTTSVTGDPIDGVTATKLYQVASNLVAGNVYRISFTITGYSGTGNVGFVNPINRPTNPLALSGNGIKTVTSVLTTSTSLVRVYTLPITNTANFSNISIRQVIGYHAFQETEANRHQRLVTPQTGRNIFVPSGTQVLTATMPNLGSCTVLRPRPGPDGTIDSTTETINGAYNVTETNRVFCGCVIVKGTLTSDQEYVLRQLFGWYRPGLSEEKVVNGEMAIDASFTKGTGWSIANGTANFVGGTPSYLTQAFSTMVIGEYFQFRLSVTAISGNSVSAYIGASPPVGTANAVGTFTYAGVFGSGTPRIAVRGNSAASDDTASVDNISVRKII